MNLNNINNESLVFKDDDYIYYSNISEELGGLYRKSLILDLKEKIISNENIKNIQREKDFLYFSADYKIYKLNLYTKNLEVIFKSKYFISFIVVINENIYINLSDENSSLFIKNLKTSEETKIAEDIYGFNIYKEHMYYSGNENFGIYKLNLKSKKIDKIINDNVMFPIIANDSLYYFEMINKEFWELNLKSNEIVKLDIDFKKIGVRDVNFYNILDDKLIFSTSRAIFKFNLDTNELIKLKDYYSSEINIINDVIFCNIYIDNTDYIYGFKENGMELFRF